jgi:sugar O-acyltransferase (sialic acid O-acetyltransferase NeuD family)
MSETTMTTLNPRLDRDRDLLLYGSGGFGRETAQLVNDLNSVGARWRLQGFIDDNPARHGKVIEGTPVIGGREQIEDFPDALLAVCTGRPDDYLSRMRIVAELGIPARRYATLVHPSAVVSSSSTVGPGTVVLAQVVLTASVRIGSHVAIMPHATLTHDDVVEDFVTIASGVRLGGGVHVHRGAYLGAGALIGENRAIGEYSLVGMGSVLTRDVPAQEVWLGAPARYRRDAAVSAGGGPSFQF